MFRVFLTSYQFFRFKRSIRFQNIRGVQVVFLFRGSDAIRNHVFKLNDLNLGD